MKCLIQYVGKTVDEFHFRWNNYKNNFRNCDCDQPCIQRYLYELYSSVGDCRFLLVSITLIDKTDPSDPFFFCLAANSSKYFLNIGSNGSGSTSKPRTSLFCICY